MLTLVTAPAGYPVTLDEAKIQLRIRHSEDDIYISGLIATATADVEEYTGRPMVEQTWLWARDDWPQNGEWFPKYPVVSLDSVEYVDAEGVEQTLAVGGLYVNDGALPRIYVNPDISLPSVKGARPGDVRITFTAGYATANGDDYGLNVPAPMKHAVLLMIGHHYENREAVNIGSSASEIPLGVKHLLAPYKIWHP